jgi:hypothetical protein
MEQITWNLHPHPNALGSICLTITKSLYQYLTKIPLSEFLKQLNSSVIAFHLGKFLLLPLT